MAIRVKAHHPMKGGVFWVDIEEDGVPRPIRLHFARWEDEAGNHEWVNVGFELPRPEINETTERTDVLEVDPAVLPRIAERWESYLAIARGALDFDFWGAAAETAELRAEGQGRRGLSPEFFRKIADEYRGLVESGKRRGAVSAIARAHGVNRSTASRWVSEARRLESSEEETR